MPNEAIDNGRLLDSIEAAYSLGITTELLLSYVRYSPKSRPGEAKRLIATQDGGSTKFRASDLLEFDAYLQQPWSDSPDDRPAIPSYIVDYLKVECGGQCPRCGKGYKIENAHIDAYAQSLSHHHHNLIRLCSACHDEFDSKRIFRQDEIKRLKAHLIAQTRERLRQSAGVQRETFATPSPASVFLGRVQEMEVLSEALSKHRSICIKGIGGIGKTQLLLNVLKRCEDVRPTVWINVESYNSAIDLEFSLRMALTYSERIDCSSPLSELLDRSERRVVFDGVEAITPTYLEQLEDFLSILITSTKSTVFIFTSQVELFNVDVEKTIEVGPIEAAASIELIQTSTGAVRLNLTDGPMVSWLVDFCGGHPLTLKIVAGLIRYFKSTSIAVDRIQKLRSNALLNPARRNQSKATSLGISLAAAYSAMSPDERRLLFVAAHCPVGYLVQLCNFQDDFGVPDEQTAVAALRRWHLLNTEESVLGQRLLVSSPVRTFIQDMYEIEEPVSADELIFRLVSALCVQANVIDHHHISGGNIAHGMRRMGEEYPNFIHALKEADRRSRNHSKYLEYISSFALSLQVFCFVSGLSQYGIQIMISGANAAVRSGNLQAASDILMQLIAIATREDDRALLATSVKELTEISAGATDSILIGNVAMAQGILAFQERRLDDALAYFETAGKCYGYRESPPAISGDDGVESKRTCDAGERALPLALMEQGRVHEHKCRYVKALEVYEAALTSMEKINDEINCGAVLHHIGNCNAALHRHRMAYQAYHRAANHFFHIGAAIHLSNSLFELGYLLIDHDPDEKLREEFPAELIDAGLQDASYLVTQRFSVASIPLPTASCIHMVQRFFGLSILANFASQNTRLLEIADALRHEVVRPLSEQLEQERRRREIDGLPIMHLDVTLALVGTAASFDVGLGDGERPSLDQIQYLASLCYLQGKHAWKLFRLFDWLAVYLRRRWRIENITAESLWEASHNCETLGAPFYLPGVDRSK